MKNIGKKRYRGIRLGMVAMVLAISASALAAPIIVYPCPWAPESEKTAKGNLTDGITFANLSTNGDLLIYALDGTLVYKVSFNDVSGKYRWLGKNNAGEDVASGVYFWVVKSGTGTKTGKLIVIR